jgi:hypothetical protein
VSAQQLGFNQQHQQQLYQQRQQQCGGSRGHDDTVPMAICRWVSINLVEASSAPVRQEVGRTARTSKATAANCQACCLLCTGGLVARTTVAGPPCGRGKVVWGSAAAHIVAPRFVFLLFLPAVLRVLQTLWQHTRMASSKRCWLEWATAFKQHLSQHVSACAQFGAAANAGQHQTICKTMLRC